MIEVPADFVDNVDQPISLSGAVNVWRESSLVLYQMSYRLMPMFMSNTAPDPVWDDEHSSGDLRLFLGGCFFRTGMTTLTISGTASSWTVGSGIHIYVNGVLKVGIFATSTWTTSVSIASGYSDGQDLLVDVRTAGNTSRWSNYLITEAYVSPMPSPGEIGRAHV